MKANIVLQMSSVGRKLTLIAELQTESQEDIQEAGELYQAQHQLDFVRITVDGKQFGEGMTEKARNALQKFCDPKADEGCASLALEQQNRAYWQGIAKELDEALRIIWNIQKTAAPSRVLEICEQAINKSGAAFSSNQV
jgi:hypothetical protein